MNRLDFMPDVDLHAVPTSGELTGRALRMFHEQVNASFTTGDISDVHRKLSFYETMIQVGEDEDNRLLKLLHGTDVI